MRPLSGPWVLTLGRVDDDPAEPRAVHLLLPKPDDAGHDEVLAEINECLALHETGLRLVRLEVP